jgi:hypothetical protein
MNEVFEDMLQGFFIGFPLHPTSPYMHPSKWDLAKPWAAINDRTGA